MLPGKEASMDGTSADPDTPARRYSDCGQSRLDAVLRVIRAAGAHRFFLLKYSPDLNPIEQFFSKLKYWLRKAGKLTTEAV